MTIAATAQSERDSLADASALIRNLEVSPPALVLAASATAEGHWTFVNQAGQRFTAASKQELSRVYKNLATDIQGRPGPVVIYLTGASVFAHGEHLSLLPIDARLRVVTIGDSFPLRGFGPQGKRTWFAEVRPNVFVRASELSGFRETVWQLGRPLKARSMRVLALDHDGRHTFRPSAIKKSDGVPRQLIDTINPDKLVSALPTLRRQTAVITGRLSSRDTLIYRTATGGERKLALGPLRDVAAQSDINLVFVNAAAPRQPGVRNWLWLRAEVDGLVAALKRETLGDFLNELAGSSARLFVETRSALDGRVSLSVVPMRAGVLEREPGTISSMLAELVSEVAGNVLPHAVDADLVSMRRQLELDRRVLPGIASWIQIAFGAVLLIGLVGLPVALSWWRRVWSPEKPEDYADRVGFETARGIRLLVFAVLFLPLVGIPAVIWGIAHGIGWLVRRGRRTKSADAEAPAS